MSDTAAEWIERILTILADDGYSLGQSAVGSAMLATKRVNSLGPFLPCTDHLFIHDLTDAAVATRFEALHAEAREWVDARFRLPKPMRYHIPNTVSIGVSDRGFPAETIDFARSNKLRSPLLGGEKDSTYLIDVAERRLLSAGVEVTPGRYGSANVTTVNPTNRTLDMMEALLKRLRSL